MSRPTLVLGPSLGTSADALWGACSSLLTDDLDVAPWDLPGHGGEPGPSSARLTVPDLAAVVLERLDDRAFHYAGDSVGGAVGLQLLLDAPDRVLSATLLCTGARIGTRESWEERIEQVRRSGTPSLVEASARRWFGAGFLGRQPERASALLHALSDTSDEGYVAVCGALATFDVRDRLGEIAAPVLAVAGADDTATPPQLLREVAEGVQHGRVVVLDGVGHLAPAEAPEAVAALISEHVLATRDGERA